MAELSLSPVLVVRNGGKWRVETVDVECHVALIAQQLHVSVLLPATHAAGAEAALGVRVGLAVLTFRPALPWFHKHTHEQTLEANFVA